MARNTDYQLAVLIVSTSEQFNILAKKALPGGKVRTLEIRKSASTAMRELLERSYDLVIINAPVSDELGVDLAYEAATRHQGNVIIAVPAQIFDDVTEKLIDYGVMTLPKPFEVKSLGRSVRLACAVQEKLKNSAAKVVTLEKKMEELRVISRAKLILVQKGMSEEDAHELILKKAMDNCMTKRQVAEEIIDDL